MQIIRLLYSAVAFVCQVWAVGGYLRALDGDYGVMDSLAFDPGFVQQTYLALSAGATLFFIGLNWKIFTWIREKIVAARQKKKENLPEARFKKLHTKINNEYTNSVGNMSILRTHKETVMAWDMLRSDLFDLGIDAPTKSVAQGTVENWEQEWIEYLYKLNILSYRGDLEAAQKLGSKYKIAADPKNY